MDRLNQFKKKRFVFGSTEARVARACEIEKKRKQQRSEDIARSRLANIADEDLSNALLLPEEVQSNDAQVSNRVKQLMKWKAEKELRKKIDAQTKKPPFVVGIPHYKPWSTTTKNTLIPHCQHHESNKTKPIVPTRITRATAKRLAEKNFFTENTKLLKLVTTNITKNKNKKKRNKSSSEENVPTFPSAACYVFHAPKGIAPVRMLNVKDFPAGEKLQNQISDIVEKSFIFNKQDEVNQKTVDLDLARNTKNFNKNQTPNTKLKTLVDKKTLETKSSDKTIILVNSFEHENNVNILHQSPIPATFSPFITTKRGKSNARNEQRERLGLNSPLSNITPTKNTVSDILNASNNEPQRTTQYYKYLLNQKTDLLLNLCKNWEEIQQNPDTTDEGRYIINQAIGQTKLLINKKFQRFQSLVMDCEKGKKELLVTCRDLEGFWDMMSMEIKDCHLRFEKLDKLKMNSWVEEQPDVKEVVKIKKQPVRKIKINGKSSMRAFIEATRKQKKNEQKTESILPDHIFLPKKRISRTRVSTGRKNLGKTPEVKLDNSISYINSDQTPGKSILKRIDQTEKFHDELSKSTVKVNFNDVVIYDDVLSNKVIENCKNEPFSNIVKTLDFDQNDSINNDNLKNSDISIDKLSSQKTSESMLLDIDVTSKLPYRKRSTKRKARSPIVENNEFISLSRVLRSHSQFEHNTSKKICNNLYKIESFNKEYKTSLLSSTLNVSKDKLYNESAKENDCTLTPFNHSTELTPYQRRSTRKSIKLDHSGECTACINLKSTPMSRKKSRKLNSLEKSGFETIKSSDKDLMLFYSPLITKKKKRKSSANLLQN